MQITKNELKQIIEEELTAVAEAESAWRAGGDALRGSPLPRSYSGPSGEEVVTPSSVTGELWNLAAKIRALGEKFFSDSESLSDWIESFMERRGIAQQYGLEENEVEESFGPMKGTEPLYKPMSDTEPLSKPMSGTGKLPGSGAGGSGKGRPEHPEAARLRRQRGR